MTGDDKRLEGQAHNMPQSARVFLERGMAVIELQRCTPALLIDLLSLASSLVARDIID